MKINTNSWHYRYLTWREEHENSFQIPYSLCPYVRAVGGGLAWMTGAAIALAGATGFVLWFLVIQPGINIATGGLFGIAVYLFYFYLILQIDDVRKAVPSWFFIYEFKSKEESKPNIFFAYVKATHNKVCPQLEFVDDRRKK